MFNINSGEIYRICSINNDKCFHSFGTIYGNITINQCINALNLNIEYSSDDINNFYHPDICTIPWLENEFSSEGTIALFYGLMTILMYSFAILTSISICQAQLGVKCFKKDGLCEAKKLKRGRNIFAHYLWCCCCCCKGKKKKLELDLVVNGVLLLHG